ncbi:MAG TPA: hypothetical protein VGR28_15250 [Candidatus Thermoplasmatota archaeon]|jgi:exonuclease VII large subunit|nr:hypothetical protein [Candidatus Thermoplasmatota archaeon]
MAPRKPARRRADPVQQLQKRLARVERHVGRSVHSAIAKAEADLAAEERKLARALRAAEKRLAAKERRLARRMKAAVEAAERKAAAEERKLARDLGRTGRRVGYIAQKGMWSSVDKLGPAKARARRRRRG